MKYWSNRLQMDLWIPLYVFLTVVPAISYSAHSSACPHDLEVQVNSCFTKYSLRLQILNSSPRKLCCGVDVETLRGVCQSYTSGVRCVKHLRRVCPTSTHPTIDNVLTSIDGESSAGLMDLCEDDHMIESYAIYQACIDAVGTQSEHCFTSHLKDSSTIRFLSVVSTEHKATFCRNMRDTVKCVQHNVQLSCQEQAAVDLAVLLVKPMVRDSSQCNYSMVEQGHGGSKQTDGEKSAYISDDGRFNRNSKSSGNSPSKNSNNKNSGGGNQRRHKHRNSNSGGQHQASNRGSNAGSRSSGRNNNNNNNNSNNNPGGGATGIHSTGFHCSYGITLSVSVLLTVVFRRSFRWVA